MEEILSQRITPLIKCMVLFLIIFTAKVLTSRPQESQEYKNNVQHLKPAHYVRTFTKYHHRRTIQWNNLQDINNNWPITQGHSKVSKRSVDFPVSDEYVGIENSFGEFSAESGSENIIDSFEKKQIEFSKDGVPKKIKMVLKPAVILNPPTTVGPRISCLYMLQKDVIHKSVTPSYAYVEDMNTQYMVDSEWHASLGAVSEMSINGKTVQVQLCNPRDSCYTLYSEIKGNITILGQGCWTADSGWGDAMCTRALHIPNSKICYCSKDYCNGDFITFPEVVESPKAVVDTDSYRPNNSHIVASVFLPLVALLVLAVIFNRLYCKKTDLNKDDISDGLDVEKGDVMGTGSDCLATGLLCVDNLTLTEHIGQGRFGSVWRGTLGSAPVAVKLYSHAGAWQKETAIYTLPHLTHANLLKYYGSDSRPCYGEGGCREQLAVLELCARTLRARLEAAPVSWLEFAALAHGTASALAHLHTPSGSKPCIVHRDINSNNVLVTATGQAKLADLDLAVPLYTRYYRDQGAPSRITEAGTLRYLSPEALEGALDLSGARAALCAVDVFALGLVLWEMLWRCQGAHPHHAPPYRAPYHPHLPANTRPTLAQMQSLVSRNKARPPLPAGPVPEARALKIATDTCDECWDHDAEARLTAVCVEERMAELKVMLLTQGPVIHDNNLHSNPSPDASSASPTEADKNSNCISAQTSDVKTPLLYPPQPHIGRNACIERNTHTNTQTHTVELIHKSLKDISIPAEMPRVQNVQENCLSVARVNHYRVPTQENSDRMNEIRTYHRPLDYVQNDVSSHDSDRGLKETNLMNNPKTDKPKWGIRKFFEKKLKSKALQTEVKLVPDVSNGSRVQNATVTSVVNQKPSNVNFDRPANLVLSEDRTYDFEIPCTLSPPNRTLSPTMLIESEMNRSENKVFRRLPSDETDATKQNQIFAVIVPKAKPTDYNGGYEMRSKESGSRGSSESINKQSVRTSMSSQSFFKSGNSESEDSTVKKRLSCDNRIITNASNSGRSSRASVNLELTYIDNNQSEAYNSNSPYELNSDCSISEDENLMLLSENGGSKITMQTVPKTKEGDKRKFQNEVLKETVQTKPDFVQNKHQYKYKNFDNEFSDPQDKENIVNGYSVDNPVYLATLNGELNPDLKFAEEKCKSPKPDLKNLQIKRQHSLEQVSEIFTSIGDIHLLNPAGRVKTPGDLPIAVRRARRDRALQKSRGNESNRFSLYDDRMMFGNSL